MNNNKTRKNSLWNSKRGWIRIAEAFLALMIIAIVLVSVYSVRKQGNTTEINKIEDSILDSISEDSALREAVLSNNIDAVNDSVSVLMPASLNFEIRICEVNDICNLLNYRANVYARERIISSTLEIYSPKKLKLFVWEK